MNAEPCIYLTSDGVYVSTRYKRVLCRGLSSPVKTLKDLEKVVEELPPQLRSVSFAGNEPPSITDYNIFLAGSFAATLLSALENRPRSHAAAGEPAKSGTTH